MTAHRARPSTPTRGSHPSPAPWGRRAGALAAAAGLSAGVLLVPTAGAAAAPVAPQVAAPASSLLGAQTAVTGSGALRAGDRGAQVQALQQRLSDLGYWLGTPDGAFGPLTEQAVYALQGAAGLARDGVVGPDTLGALDRGVRPAASTTSGHAVEIDLDRGLLLVVDDGRVGTVLHTSTGTFERYTHDGATHLADTPRGTWRVSWAVDGWRHAALGDLYRPRYFHPDGIAVHGYGSVPAHPASHGCARVSTAAMDMIWARDLMPTGSTVVVR